MTWRDWMVKYLTDRGLWPKEALEVVNAEIAADVDEESGYKGPVAEVADRSHDGYPPQMDAVMALTLNTAAIEWIDANKPNHFARLMFLPPAERDAILDADKEAAHE